MSISLNLSDVIAHVKNIVDSIRCTVCDKACGGRIRFLCGHTSCDDCLIGADGCMLCVTPPSCVGKPKSDITLSQRVQNAFDLLNACQDTFNLDVYRRLRVSEQLRAEKELFPECIQAPAKYCNKRKSFTRIENKENLHNSIQPGEHVSHTESFKMKKCNNYVQQWLENSNTNPRQALGDLNVNKQNQTKKNKILQQNTVKSYLRKGNESYVYKDTFNAINATTRKRPNSSKSFSLIGKENSGSECIIKKFKTKNINSYLHDDHEKKILENKDNEESGIVLDDEPILIEDSQSQVIDKDKIALLAVQVTDEEPSDFISLALEESTEDINLLPPVCIQLNKFAEEQNNNVPFYKKSSLANCCFYCKIDHKLNKPNNDSKDVSITIENQHFITTVNISKCALGFSDKKFVLVETNLNDTEKAPDNNKRYVTIEGKNNEMELADKKNSITDSLELLKSQDINNLHRHDIVSKKEGIIIDDSDSDDYLEGSLLQVTAEVHRSCEPKDYGVLTEISTSELPSKSRKKVRCITPDSNNSSDKENCDPNKRKKLKNEKKNKYSKK